ncbi:MAG: fatty acid desaturase [Steroidobacterales bacterium]
MEPAQEKQPVSWYRVPVPREALAQLTRRSDMLGTLQTLGHLGLLATTGSLAFLGAQRWNWPWEAVAALVFVHGMCWNFLINGFHELIHETVFRTRWLNGFFLRIFSFLGWHNHHLFWTSHTEHHKYTLHPPRDQEVVLPVRLTLRDFADSAIVNVKGLVQSFATTIRHARGRLDGEWEHTLFDNNPDKASQMFNWARVLLAGHAAIAVLALWMNWWMFVVLVTFAQFYGGWLFYLCNNTQHVGLQDFADDYRACCRTIYLNPLVRFLYWHMNYHTEHHMYAAVPCYRLARLHRLIRSDLPECPRGLYATWKHIAMILERQKREPAYQFAATFAPRRERPV